MEDPARDLDEELLPIYETGHEVTVRHCSVIAHTWIAEVDGKVNGGHRVHRGPGPHLNRS